MRQRPDAAELERLAESILRDNPLPEDPKTRNYEQRMALKARTIAEYDRKHGAADMADELVALMTLYGEEAIRDLGVDEATRIEAANRRLAAEIRAGKWDDVPAALTDLLMRQVRARLARSNPKYLDATFGR